MSTEAQRVVIIQDGTRELRTDGVRWVLQNLSVKEGDMIRLFRVVQPFMMNPNVPFTLGCGGLFRTKSPSPPSSSSSSSKSFNDEVKWSSSISKFVIPGYRRKLHSSETIKRRQESIKEEIAMKQDEIQNNVEIKKLLRLTEAQQIDLETVVEAGHSLKEFTVHAAMNYQATSVIIESCQHLKNIQRKIYRQMKKDQKYLLDNLSCDIYRMRQGDRVERIRETMEAKIEDLLPSERFENTRASTSSEGLNIFPDSHEQENIVVENFPCSVCGHTRPRKKINFREFLYTELAHSTRMFSQKNILPESDKTTYKGVLRDGMKIVVKKHSLASKKEDEFMSEVHILSKARHENLVTLLGSCSKGENRLLVYEYACNGSLNAHLSARNKELTWERRLKIATGVARGLDYLHRNNIYGSVRPSNILLTHDYEPRVTNYGLTVNQYEGVDHSSETRTLRTFEYLPTEYGETGVDSSNTDVFSFGVLLLELITGRKTIQETDGNTYLRWARPLVRQKMYGALIDPAVLDSHDLYQLVWMVRIIERCISFNPEHRCSIEQVVKVLTDVAEVRVVEDLPLLEPEM